MWIIVKLNQFILSKKHVLAQRYKKTYFLTSLLDVKCETAFFRLGHPLFSVCYQMRTIMHTMAATSCCSCSLPPISMPFVYHLQSHFVRCGSKPLWLPRSIKDYNGSTFLPIGMSDRYVYQTSQPMNCY